MSDSYIIIPVNGHYEVYVDGNFYCSADTKLEAEQDILEFGLDLD